MTSQDHAQNSAWSPPSPESSKVGWHQLGTYWTLTLQGEVGSLCCDSVFAVCDTWTQGLGDIENRRKLPNPWLVREKVRGQKELMGG